ncbi:MAG: protein-L-isoaspartate(D-aspartate) O-methyltransferase [Acidimicrobiia bacterium]|nr:protein-L-isoaspartate(D-aspartate) O-methyltransferase [Acidimicrobiia bacterium]
MTVRNISGIIGRSRSSKRPRRKREIVKNASRDEIAGGENQTGGDINLQRRLAMVEEQLRSRGVTDPKVLAAMATVPRHRFVHESHASVAYQDHPLPIAADQTISQPYMVGLMAQEAELAPTDRVLEVGTGSGYAAAVLAHLAAEVITIERHLALAKNASVLLAELGYENVRVIHADGSLGYPQGAPYSAILVAAATPTIPRALDAQIADHGRLIIPLGSLNDVQKLTRLRKVGGQTSTETISSVRFVPLIQDTDTE